MKNLLVAFFSLLLPAFARAQSAPEVIHLWANGAPGFENRKDEPEEAKDYWVKNVHNPSLTVYLPPEGKATGAAAIICPGGGHRLLVFDGEGRAPAEYLAKLGVTCFALKYRLPREEGSPYTLDKTLAEDGHRAVRLVRSLADKYHLDPKRVGMIGFSAGAEVVSYTAYDPAPGDPNAGDAVDRLDGRPDFQVLIYPGPLGIPETVPKDAPPALLVVANDDGSSKAVLEVVQKYRAAGAPVELHLLGGGGHAFNMGDRSKLAAVQHWPERMAEWLADRGLLTAAPTK
jgi:acetyl esterase/lipase